MAKQEFTIGAKCEKNIVINSPKCKKCSNYINSEILRNSHGRAESVIIKCELFEEFPGDSFYDDYYGR